ncbi:hypothetical protein DFH11DRAFT_109460 [Phellopilus nigrolimitatus]|nr:hypothetical protein DFH11DRAFT_109460 [Phellopilus nigrolimitatus]
MFVSIFCLVRLRGYLALATGCQVAFLNLRIAPRLLPTVHSFKWCIRRGKFARMVRDYETRTAISGLSVSANGSGARTGSLMLSWSSISGFSDALRPASRVCCSLSSIGTDLKVRLRVRAKRNTLVDLLEESRLSKMRCIKQHDDRDKVIQNSVDISPLSLI